jgi:Mrp family chromosome partitioning ATPase
MPGEAALFAMLADAEDSAQFRQLARQVESDTQGIRSPVIAVVGFDGDDTTPLVAAALATLLAEREGRRILLVEANPHQREISARYSYTTASGLCEVLAGQAEGASAPLTTSLERLAVLPFGHGPTQAVPAGLEAIAAAWRVEGYTTVLDAGSLSAAWALRVSQLADATYLLVRVGETPADAAVSAVNRFRLSGGKLTGCVALVDER